MFEERPDGPTVPLMSSPSPQVEAYVKLVRTAEALHAQVSRGLVAENLTASQFSALKALRFNGVMPQKAIASYLLKTAGNVTLVLDNLEKRGLITRKRQTDDRRVVDVDLTPSGRDTFDRVYPAHIARIEAAMSALDPEATTCLCDLLRQLHPTINDPACGPGDAESSTSLAG
ncbi:MAG: MarR family transcriptional regulator [Fimbriimonadaceae bacterium]|nr:MarR family transcriptional regulator [Fimbriimonadaceae bacterium]